MAEVNQATGARSRIIYCKEAVWGTASVTAADYREHLLVGGETLDDNIQTYRSAVIRSDRMRNRTVRGTRRPGGGLPFELSAKGISHFIWHALGDNTTTGVGPYTHEIKGFTSLPVGFTLEKGFLDLTVPQYMALKGCRIAGMNINMGVDQIVSGSFDIMARESSTSGVTLSAEGVAIEAPDALPFTSVQAVLSKDGVAVSVCQSLSINLSNGLYGDTGFVIGSNYRANLKPGTREVTGNAVFLFDNMDFYNAAVAGTDMELEIVCTDASSHSVTILLPKVQLLPNNSSPKIANDGPLVIPANFEALKDDTEGTDIVITIVNDEASIEV
jgi:hypothetical protein